MQNHSYDLHTSIAALSFSHLEYIFLLLHMMWGTCKWGEKMKKTEPKFPLIQFHNENSPEKTAQFFARVMARAVVDSKCQDRTSPPPLFTRHEENSL
jgi:hypothetical protein